MKLSNLDKLFSQFIRMRAIARVHGCERCGAGKTSYQQLQCSHLIGRARKGTRWDEDNAIGLCAGCHMYLTSHPLEHVQWFKNYVGDQIVDLLLARSRVKEKPDEKLLAIYFRTRIKELEDDLHGGK